MCCLWGFVWFFFFTCGRLLKKYEAFGIFQSHCLSVFFILFGLWCSVVGNICKHLTGFLTNDKHPTTKPGP